MQIECPWCGRRPLEEFHYGGDATVQRPSRPESAGETDWIEYIYLRNNPAGLHTEHWQHVGGCRSWLIVERDTSNHEIHSIKLASDVDSEKTDNLVK